MRARWYRWQADTLILDVRVQPKASRDELAGVLDNRLKIRLTAPPVDGKANQALVKFVARLCGVSRKQVTLLAGETSRNKRLRIDSPARLPEGVKHP
jgi:uncharacterized protein (TIGR00251 family)